MWKKNKCMGIIEMCSRNKYMFCGGNWSLLSVLSHSAHCSNSWKLVRKWGLGSSSFHSTVKSDQAEKTNAFTLLHLVSPRRRWVHIWVRFPSRVLHVLSGSFSLPQSPLTCSLGIKKKKFWLWVRCAHFNCHLSVFFSVLFFYSFFLFPFFTVCMFSVALF